MNRNHSRRLAFRPSVDLLEGRRLLSHIANWDGMPNNATIVTYDDGRGAYAVPGMGLQVDVEVPADYVGLVLVAINVKSVSAEPGKTAYSQDLGKYVAGDLQYNVEWWADPSDPDDPGKAQINGPYDSNLVQVDSYDNDAVVNFYAPKDEGTYTVSIFAVAWYVDETDADDPPAIIYDSKSDSLTMKVEAPEVDVFKVFGMGPNYFGWMDDNRIPANQNTGTLFGFTSVQPDGTVGFKFAAKVTNDTHYEVTVGFLQEISMLLSIQYEGGPLGTLDTSVIYTNPDGYLWDGGSVGSVWYKDQENLGHWNIPVGTTEIFEEPVPDNPNLFYHVSDSPSWGVDIAQDAPGAPNSILLQRLAVGYQAQTHLTIMEAGGILISLSTARWSVLGAAENLTATTLQQASNPANWDTSLITPTQAEVYPGDGKIEYLSWPANADKAREGTGGQGASVQGPDPLFFDKRFGSVTSKFSSYRPRFLAFLFPPPGSEGLPPSLNLKEGLLKRHHALLGVAGQLRKDGWA